MNQPQLTLSTKLDDYSGAPPPPPMSSKVRSREERQLDINVDRRRGGKDILKFSQGGEGVWLVSPMEILDR